MLQNFGNNPSYAKEAYMIMLDPFVENNKARVNQFLNNLCEVEDFYDTLEVRGRNFDLSPFDVNSLDGVTLAGPIYDALQERPPHPYHPQRVVQHALSNLTTH